MVRRAVLSDAPTIARIQVETWRAAYRDLFSLEGLRELDLDRRERQWKEWLENPPIPVHVYVSEDAGFVSIGPSRDDDRRENAFEIYAIYVHPSKWSAGHGRALCEEALADAKARGGASVTLWVLEGNTRARAFYEKAGFTLDGGKKNDRIGTTDVVELRYVKAF